MLTGRKIKETPLHIQIVHAIRLDFLPADLIFLHIPNGGGRDAREAVTLQKMGVLPGAYDLLFHWPVAIEEEGKKGLWMDTGYIEIKTVDGELSDNQKTFRDRVVAMGGKTAVGRNYPAVRHTLIGWGVRCQNRVHFS